MITEKLHQKIRRYTKNLQKFTDRIWYPPLIGLLSALDNFIVVIPNDGILISSAMISPKRWLNFALCITIGSTLGAFALAYLVEQQGLPWILQTYPSIDTTKTWQLTQEFFDKFGLYLVFFVAVTPFMQQPAVILAVLASTPFSKLIGIIFVGRLIKYLIMSYVGSHAPKLLNKMWGLKDELKDAGVHLK